MGEWRTQAQAGDQSAGVTPNARHSMSDQNLRQWLLREPGVAQPSGSWRTKCGPVLHVHAGQAQQEVFVTMPELSPQTEDDSVARPVPSTPAPSAGAEPDRAGAWLRFAGVAVGLVAVAAAVVSYEAQWRLVYRDKQELAISYVQAAIPDLGSLVFACFGIALALHGRRAVRARLLNVLCVGISVTMNALAAQAGWSALAVWVMSPVIYALASDTLIGVVRAYVIARQQRLREVLADDGVTPLQIVGAALLWLLRLAWAPPSTIRGFGLWVKSLPAAPPVRGPVAEPVGARVAGRPALEATARPSGVTGAGGSTRAAAVGRGLRGATKQQHFLTLVIARYGPLTEFDLRAVSRTAAELAPEAELHPGTARKILRARVIAAQNGDPQ
jgi:hypothetical protein